MDDLIKAVNKAPEIKYANMTWKVWHDKLIRQGQMQIDIDHKLLELHYSGKIPACIRLWQNELCLVLSKRDTKVEDFDNISNKFKDESLPIFTRTSGGTVVPHGPGILNISLIFSVGRNKKSLDWSYNMLCNFVIGVLGKMGLSAGTSSVTNSFCDGKYNLVVDGQKIGGTAQRIKRDQTGKKYFLSHMSLLVDVDINTVSENISQFYRLANNPTPIAANTITTMQEGLLILTGKKSTVSDIVDKFVKVIHD